METIMLWLMWFFGIAAVLLCGLLVFALVHEAIWPSPILATLKVSEWTCAASHVETQTHLMPVGKVMIPQTSYYTVCDRYERKQ